MKIAPLADVKARWSAYVDECGVDGPIVITRNGKAVAVLLVPNDDDDLERLLLGRPPRFQAMLNRSRRSIQEGEGLSEADFWKAVRKRARAKGRRRPPHQALKVESRRPPLLETQGRGTMTGVDRRGGPTAPGRALSRSHAGPFSRHAENPAAHLGRRQTALLSGAGPGSFDRGDDLGVGAQRHRLQVGVGQGEDHGGRLPVIGKDQQLRSDPVRIIHKRVGCRGVSLIGRDAP
jgi:hypothetical protein